MQAVIGSGVIIALLVFFEIFGSVTTVLFKMNGSVGKNLVLGFFVYYGIFQVVALPLVLLKQSLTLLACVWAVILFVVVVVFLLMVRKRWKAGSFQGLSRIRVNIYMCFFIFSVVVVCVVALMQDYWGWDTAYYIGNINTSLYTDSMYLFDGNSGVALKEINLRYALSMFYMNSAVFCKWFGITAICMQKYVMVVLCVVLHGVIVYLAGKELFEADRRKVMLFGTIAMGLNLFFTSEYTTSQFLLLRGYEAKAYCANIVITALLWQMIALWKQKKDTFLCIFMIMFASVPISMSSILIVPLLFVIGMAAEMILQKKWIWVKNGMICLIPNLVYLVVYFLYTQNILNIKV